MPVLCVGVRRIAFHQRRDFVPGSHHSLGTDINTKFSPPAHESQQHSVKGHGNNGVVETTRLILIIRYDLAATTNEQPTENDREGQGDRHAKSLERCHDFTRFE